MIADFPTAAIDSPVTDSYPSLSSLSFVTSLIPLPPPPYTDLSKTGYPISFAILVASSTSFTISGLPGTVGTLAFSIASLHSILSPQRFIDFADGPMKLILFFSHRFAKSSFSERKP